LNWDLNSLSL